MTLAMLIFEIFVLITLRVHFIIDITGGIVFAHYIFLLVDKYEENINISAEKMQYFLTTLFTKIFKSKQQMVKL